MQTMTLQLSRIALRSITAITLYLVVGATSTSAADVAAESLAAKFAGAATAARNADDAQRATAAARIKSDQANSTADEAKRKAAAKRAEEKARKLAAATAAAKAAKIAAAQSKADEVDMLERARAEADERRRDIEIARVEADKAEAVAVAAESDRLTADAETHRLAEVQRIAEERKVAEAKAADDLQARQKAAAAQLALAEAAQRVADEKRMAAERQIAENASQAAAAAQRAIDEKRLVEDKRIADLKAEAERQHAEQQHTARRIAEVKALEDAREADGQRLEERLRQAAATRAAHAQVQPPVQPQTSTPVALPVGSIQLPHQTNTSPLAIISVAPIAADTKIPLTRATVLLVMEPGNKGIRRFDKAADPVLCVNTDCYISTGPGTPSKVMPRGQAFGPVNTLGDRAGACRHSLTCTFRNVDLSAANATIQPIDLKVLRHDRRESQSVTGDSNCRLVGARLQCAAPLTSSSYRMWIVPEALADRAGSATLDASVRLGLPSGTSAGLVDN